jgi:SSS family solute:Na+ symporter
VTLFCMTGIDLIAFTVVCGLLLGGSFIAARGKETYLVADRQVRWFPLVATLVMTEFNTATLLSFAALGYSVGPRAIGLSTVFLLGLAWYTVSVARKWKQYNGLSVAGWFSVRYGRTLGRTASVLLLTAMMGFSATYVKSLTLLLAPAMGNLSPWWLSAALVAAIAAVTMSGGLAAVIRLDVIGFVLTLILIPTLLVCGWWKADGISSGQLDSPDYWRQWDHPELPWWFVISLIVLTCLTYISTPWYGQMIFAAVDEKTAVRAVGTASIIVFLLYASVQLAASFLATTIDPLDDAQLAVPTMIQLWLPIGIRGVGYAVLFAVATTTLAGVWSAMVAMLVSDFTSGWTENIQVQRLMTGVLAVFSWLGSNLLVDNILNKLILANIPIAALSFALLGGFHWSRTSRIGAWVSISIGTIWGTFCFLYWGDAGGYTWPWAIYGTGLIFGSGIGASLMFPDTVAATTS